MTTPDPSREAFYAWLRTHEDEVGALDDPSALAGWQAAMAHKGAEPKPAEDEGWQRLITAPSEHFVLVAAEFDCPGDWRIKIGYLNERGVWHVLGASWEPTRWMPLPAAPKQEGST